MLLLRGFIPRRRLVVVAVVMAQVDWFVFFWT
jgi:hypothetical protein